MSEKKFTFREAIRLQIRAMKLFQQVAPGSMTTILLTALVTAVTPYVTIWFSAQIINELSGACRPQTLWTWIGLTLGVELILALTGAWLKRRKEVLSSRFYWEKNQLYVNKYLSMDYQDVDDQRIRDLRTRITQNENWEGWGMVRAWNLTETLSQGTIGVVSSLALTVSLFTQPIPEGQSAWAALDHPLFTLALLLIMIGLILLGTRWGNALSKAMADLADQATLGNRKYMYNFMLMYENKRALDIRTYNQQDMVDEYMTTSFAPGGPFDKLESGPVGIRAALGNALGTIFTGFVYVFTCLKAWAGAFGIGSVTQYVGAATALSQNIASLATALEEMRNNATFLRDTYELLDTPNKMYQGSLTTEKRSDRQYQVEFRNVSFQYPGSERWALRNVSIKFQVGKRLAIVGENGSGKTTFIKLLCRLYDPQEGEILLNGIDIRKYDYRDYMDIFSVVFQDFQLLSQSLGSNVAGAADYDRARVEQSLRDAGFADRLSTLPKGLDTQLYKHFTEEGVEVSGGEGQKIAIARALYKDAPFIILDEPTAALDPIAEAEIYEKFDAIAQDKTAIYISHRLSSCKFCDEIAVFDGGSVIQHGSHESLLADEGGKYSALWKAQAQYYVQEEA